MVKTQEPRKTVVYGICTNTGGKEDGTPCLKCKNKEVQAIRASKDFICEECGEPLTKIDYRPRPKWPLALLIALAVIVCGVGAYFAFFKGYEENKSVSLTLNKESITLNVGECDTLMASVSTQPIDAVVSVIFISDNCNIAQVDSSGVIRAISIGETNITVVAQMETGVADTVCVKVVVDVELKDIPADTGNKKLPKEKGNSVSSNADLDIDWNKSVSVSDADVSATLNGLIGTHTQIDSYVKRVLEKCFTRNAVVDKIGVNGSTLVNYHQPIKAYLESICVSKYLTDIEVLELRRNSIGRITYLKVQERYYNDSWIN